MSTGNFSYIITDSQGSKVFYHQAVPINKTAGKISAPKRETPDNIFDVLAASDGAPTVSDNEVVEGGLYRYEVELKGGVHICHWIIDAPNPTKASINTTVGKAVVLFGTKSTKDSQTIKPKIVPVLAADGVKMKDGGNRMYYFQVA